MGKKTYQVYKVIPHPTKTNIDGFFDVYFVGGKSACQKYMKENPSDAWHLGVDVTAEELQWFDSDGWLMKEIPTDCIDECSQPGDVTASVQKWVMRLGFDVSPCLNVARKYLQDFGAWDDLVATDDEHPSILAGSWELSQRLLWVACGNIAEESKENEYEYDMGAWIGCNS